jgi:peroxiredoxin
MSSVALNAPAPDFTLTDSSGKTVHLSDFRGKTNVLLVFNRGFM